MEQFTWTTKLYTCPDFTSNQASLIALPANSMDFTSSLCVQTDPQSWSNWISSNLSTAGTYITARNPSVRLSDVTQMIANPAAKLTDVAYKTAEYAVKSSVSSILSPLTKVAGIIDKIDGNVELSLKLGRNAMVSAAKTSSGDDCRAQLQLLMDELEKRTKELIGFRAELQQLKDELEKRTKEIESLGKRVETDDGAKPELLDV